jgi:hypothetical protein
MKRNKRKKREGRSPRAFSSSICIIHPLWDKPEYSNKTQRSATDSSALVTVKLRSMGRQVYNTQGHGDINRRESQITQGISDSKGGVAKQHL